MGIGYAITKDICEMGGSVAVLDLRETPLEPVLELAKQFDGIQTHYFQADVSDEQSLRSGFDRSVQALGKLDGTVTAAGIAIDKPFVHQGWDEVNKVIQVNVSDLSPCIDQTADGCCRVLDPSFRHRWQSSRCKSKEPQGA